MPRAEAARLFAELVEAHYRRDSKTGLALQRELRALGWSVVSIPTRPTGGKVVA